MKKIFNVHKLPLLLTLFVLGSCVKLDEAPEGVVSPENFYKTEADFEAGVVGIYSPLVNGWAGFDSDMPYIAGAGAEDIRTNVFRWQVFESFQKGGNGQDEVTSSVWKMCYAVVNNANLMIANLDHAPLTKEKSDGFEGQAKFLRALSYFYLTRWFGEVPLILPENMAMADQAGQASVLDVYKVIVQDLKDAEEKLPTSYPEKGKATRGAAKALLAKVYLTMAGWYFNGTAFVEGDKSFYALARDKAKEVISLGLYQLTPNFGDLWRVENNTSNGEFIFALYGIGSSADANSNKLHQLTRPYSGGETGWGDFYSDERFYQAFPDGPRKDGTFWTTLLDGTSYQDSGDKQPFIFKYRDGGSACTPYENPSSWFGDGAIVLLRYADVLLMYAEAANKAEGHPSAAAFQAVNDVRNRAGLASLPATISPAEFDKAVLDERNWELAFECNRWFDLIRRNLLVEVMGTPEWYEGVDQSRMLLPKPTTELLLIEGLKQNPGY